MSDLFRKLLAEREAAPVSLTPQIGIVTLHFQLYGVADLKAKRKAFTPMKAIWGREPDLAVAETGDFEALDSAVWSVVAIGGTSQQLTARLDQVEKAIEQRIDAPVLDVHRELL
ncbi:hypothetical protein SAMN05216203_3204 [Marinobacter daqiaonensis]|uniref:DUF503 domain-containing protein n=1 Tax=Marinobacter daqiaonensis TaxID=650891 RepID=A0A1I6JRT2_9GAMM|nr:DUF503 family protein [Marinobacter daqiaonensis]SFR81682.1 hypothetical protein SAMN05216203_3204 [Marinobacter daqiaonensis]